MRVYELLLDLYPMQWRKHATGRIWICDRYYDQRQSCDLIFATEVDYGPGRIRD